MQPRDRLLEIDFLRFVAAIAVMAFHYLYAGERTGEMHVSVAAGWQQIAQYGFLGVELFFVISGFVIAMSMQHGNPLRFLLDRLIRIYPVYLLAVCVTAFVQVSAGFDLTLYQLLMNVALLPGVFKDFFEFQHIDGVYWSLMIELQFYFLVFLVLLARLQRHFERLLLLWLLLTVLSDFYAMPVWLDRLLILEWSPYFIAGAFFLQVYWHGASFVRQSALAVCLFLAIKYAVWHLGPQQDMYGAAFDSVITATLVGGIFLLFSLLVSNQLSWLRYSWMIWLGGLTYPLYLLHQNIGYVVFAWLAERVSGVSSLLLLIGLMLLVSLLVHFVIERVYIAPLRTKLHARIHADVRLTRQQQSLC